VVQDSQPALAAKRRVSLAFSYLIVRSIILKVPGNRN
jgi:hypothetical protein